MHGNDPKHSAKVVIDWLSKEKLAHDRPSSTSEFVERDLAKSAEKQNSEL